MSKKYYRTVIEVEILSENPIGDRCYSLDELAREIEQGDYSGQLVMKEQDEVISGPEMATALINQGSDPEFFMLDEQGNEINI